MVGQAFLKTGTSSIRLSLVTDLLDRSVMKDIDFGGAIYAYLFRGMDEAVRTKSSKGQILGFSIILQYWWFEYARTLNPIQDPLYNGDEVPRIKAWGKNRVEKHYGTVRHSIHLSRQQIEMATANKIVWTPWITSCIMVRERDSFAEDGSMQNYWDVCHHALDLSRRRVVFISPGPLKAWYLGDRAWRQLTGEVAIPHPPLEKMCAVDVTLAQILWHRENHWPFASSFITADYGTYDYYWATVSRGSILPGPIYRASNLDLVTPEALRQDLQFPGPSQATYAPGGYDAHVLLGVDPTDDVWTARMVGSEGQVVNYAIPPIDNSVLPQLDPRINEHDVDTLRSMYSLSLRLTHGMRRVLLDTSRQSFKDLEAERARGDIAEHELEDIRLRFGQAYMDSQGGTIFVY
ncbi:hypothetical protein IFM89_009201 [Coptis chinensis]|uniref:Aminotransferase-like plant mobile domain-containing protein n=1 Tax=Coptis chinensis TaxID=261450 RepID=A0A835M983_9MAGN|nr:hypothetical protein IFM89_009201 [Coptis chinensis]